MNHYGHEKLVFKRAMCSKDLGKLLEEVSAILVGGRFLVEADGLQSRRSRSKADGIH